MGWLSCRPPAEALQNNFAGSYLQQTTYCHAGPIKVTPACLSNFSLPIVVSRGRNLTLRSNDGQPRVLDFGQVPYLLAVEDTASLTFRGMILQGEAGASLC